ncbi:MAG: DUF5684 domain-containing protein [Planctomycetes bacterium]|nr:DUF5684 domain-containing protein [Planctomycetota bacterium]
MAILAAVLVPLLIGGAIILAMVVGMWKVFVKAGQPGWASIVPIYNTYILVVEIAKKEMLWFILTFIPFVNVVIFILVCMEIAKKFGKEAGYGIGLALLPPIFFPMLGFSDARYQGSKNGGRRTRADDDDEESDGERKNW